MIATSLDLDELVASLAAYPWNLSDRADNVLFVGPTRDAAVAALSSLAAALTYDYGVPDFNLIRAHGRESIVLVNGSTVRVTSARSLDGAARGHRLDAVVFVRGFDAIATDEHFAALAPCLAVTAGPIYASDEL